MKTSDNAAFLAARDYMGALRLASAGPEALSDELKAAIDPVMTAFSEFKATNDERLKQIEAKGVADPVTVEKLDKIEKTLNGYEDLNQKVTLEAKARENAEKELKGLKDQMGKLEAKIGRPGAGDGDDAEKKKKAEYKAAFGSFLRKDTREVSPDEYKMLNEYKVLIAGDDTGAGYYLAPADMATDIIKAVVLQSPLRALARVTQIGVASLKLPKRTGVFAATRVGEIGTRSETLGYSTGMVEIKCDEMYAQVNLSQQMIEDSAYDIEMEVTGEFAEQFAVKEGAEFISGTAAGGQAEGILTNASVTSTNSGAATAITADGMISTFYNGLKTAYAKNATWIMNRQTLGSVRKLKDGDGNYLWMGGIANNVPNTILGAPYAEMPDMPNEGAGTYPIAVGDFYRGYRVVDRVLISVLRDPYTVANVGQILYRARKRVGGAVVLSEAITKLKCSA